MDKLQKVRKEIERRKAINSGGKDSEYMRGVMACYSEVLAIFDFDFEEEPASENLEEFALQYAGHHAPYDSCWQEVEDAVKAGVKWKEEQMMAKAINAQCFGFQGAALFSFRLPADNYLVGSKVKVIVVKED